MNEMEAFHCETGVHDDHAAQAFDEFRGSRRLVERLDIEIEREKHMPQILAAAFATEKQMIERKL